MNYFIDGLKAYAVFTGRASRKQYWMFILWYMVAYIFLGVIDALLGLGFLTTVYSLGLLIPSIAIGIRRMHDVDKSGWFLLIPIYSLILACTGGTSGDNRFGDDPQT